MNKILILLTFILSCSGIVISQQNPNGFNCILPDNPPPITQSVIGGQHKPESISRYTNNPLAVFRVLIVFVRFPNDPGPDVEYWPVNGEPNYLDSVISRNRINNSNWWDAYSETDARLSDFWMEASRGRLHIVGQAVHVVLPHEYTYYQQVFGTNGIKKINDDIYEILKDNPLIYWPNYDLWSKSGSTFAYVPDGKVDMIYKVHRSHSPGINMPAGGVAALGDSYSQGENYLIYNQFGTMIYINGGFGDNGSGVTMTPGHAYPESDPRYFRYAPLTKNGFISFSVHEHGHYLWGGGHQRYGKMSGQGADFGVDEFLSPYESIRLGYMVSKKVNYNLSNSYSIGDYSSRNNNLEGNVLEVPINGEYEFFLICNRQRLSSYDIIMWGDTCRGDPYFNLGTKDYGKGIYIYHANPGSPGYPFFIQHDQECADGLWNYEYVGNEYPDWSNQQIVPYFKKTIPVFNYNDISNYEEHTNTLIANKDGKSCNRYWINGIYMSWFGIGKRHIQLNTPGTDRIYTNSEEVWTSREWQGDRWDAWIVGYNQVFSPYSSPSTVNWVHQRTGIFIYLESQNGTTANFKIYKVDEGGWTEDAILQATPPSKPMLYRPVEIVNCGPGGWGNPKIIWDNNREPDMLRSGGFKHYRIYRAWANFDNIPTNYELIGTYNDYTYNDTASFIDNNQFHGVRIYCNPLGIGYNDVHYRYKVVAVDKYESASVPSDFVYIKGHPIQPDNPVNPETKQPLVFSVEQNYPNPFNPTTQIKFSLPQNTFVSVKVYNVTGELVATLVDNEYRNAGYYEVSFDGTNFASGIYFYTIEAGNFKDSKKMMLIK